MGNKCMKEDNSQSNKPKPSTIDEFHQFSKLNDKIAKSMLNQSVSIRDFSLLKVLGRGNFGKVMLVEHKETKLLYAMKIIQKSVLQTKKQLQHAKNERAVLEILDHPFIIKLHYAFQTTQKLYLVVDFAEGGELFCYLRQFKQFPEEVVKFYAAETLLALQYLHKNQIIYRDLKPENILIQNGHIKMADFGLSKILPHNRMTYSLCGTPEYLAPEILSGDGYCTKCDCWSLGVMLYEMLVGVRPFQADNNKQIFKNIMHNKIKIPESVSKEAAELLLGLLDSDPIRRWSLVDAKQCAFFRNIDFHAMSTFSITPPDLFLSNNNFSYFEQSALCQTAKDSSIAESDPMFTLSQFTYCPGEQVTPRLQSSVITHCSSYGEPNSPQ